MTFLLSGRAQGRAGAAHRTPALLYAPLDAATGKIAWSVPGGHPDAEAGDVQAVVAAGGEVYAGGTSPRWAAWCASA